MDRVEIVAGLEHVAHALQGLRKDKGLKVTDRVRVTWHADAGLAPAIRAHGPYDLIFANILLGPLKRLATPLRSLAAPGGRVVLESGVSVGEGTVIERAVVLQGAEDKVVPPEQSRLIAEKQRAVEKPVPFNMRWATKPALSRIRLTALPSAARSTPKNSMRALFTAMKRLSRSLK